MQFPNILADSDIGTLIYIIVVVIWVITSALSKSSKKKKGQKTAAKPRTNESTREAELREFIETMTGQKMEAEPEPVQTPPPPRQPKVRMRDANRHKVAFTPPTQPVRRYEPELEKLNLEKVARELQQDAPSMAAIFSGTLSSRGSGFKIEGTTLPSFKYSFGSIRSKPPNPILKSTQIKGRENLRKYLAGKVILGAPRAFEPYQFDAVGSKMS
ncbi:MAG TPA: hypothetical protein PJ991_10215 [Kiritimatiellia bacterium]|nr:hypothetical protein [Kiritimatiellia bacterium]